MVLYKLFILRIRVPITSVSCSIVDDKAYFILQFSNLRNDNHICHSRITLRREKERQALSQLDKARVSSYFNLKIGLISPQNNYYIHE